MKMIFLVLALFVAQTSFAANAPIKVNLSPTKTFLLPGSSSSCYDILTAEETATPPARSIQGLRLNFHNLSLEFPDSYQYRIVRIRVTISDANLMGGKYTHDITGNELDAHFESNNGMIQGPIIVGTQGKTTASCEFQVGHISLVSESTPFSAVVSVEVLGYAMDANGNYLPVKETTQGTVEYIP